MKTCPKCGKYIPDGGKMCIACGWKPENVGIKDNPYAEYLQGIFDQMNVGFEGKTEKTDEYRERELAAIGYIGPAFVYTYFYKARNSELVKYHANQACILFMARLLANFLGKIPLVGRPACNLCKMALWGLAFVGAKKAYANKTEPVPYLGELGIKIIQ